MSKAIDITRLDLSPEEARKLAAKARDGRVVRRLLGIASLLEGESREAAASASGMDRQTLRDWVHRYNAEGATGPYPRRSSGRPSKLSKAPIADLRTVVVNGPDPEKHEVVRWRCADLRTEIAERYAVAVPSERSANCCAGSV
jgi:transposase